MPNFRVMACVSLAAGRWTRILSSFFIDCKILLPKHVPKLRMNLLNFCLARSRGLVVKADDSQSRGCGFEPQRPILVGMQGKLAIALNIKRNKGSQMGHTKKKYFKKYLTFAMER